MTFKKSTQATSWCFDRESLLACKKSAVKKRTVNETHRISDRVRKFASGFHRRHQDIGENMKYNNLSSDEICFRDQEILVQFHAHQMQTLIGPSALLFGLRTSETALSTAITFFRRFYLSNSTVETNPRKIAVACAFFAAKVEEEKIELGLLSHATSIIQSKIQNSPLCAKELRAVTVPEIEAYERLLMEGLNYEFRCYHASSFIPSIASDMQKFDEINRDDRNPCDSFEARERSPRGSNEFVGDNDRICSGALDVAQRALIFSDALFLFDPRQTALTIIAVVSGLFSFNGKMGHSLHAYLAHRYPRKTSRDLFALANSIEKIAHALIYCTALDLQPVEYTSEELDTERAEDLKRVLCSVATIRLMRKMKRRRPREPRKRARIELEFTPPWHLNSRKFARITPTNSRDISV